MLFELVELRQRALADLVDLTVNRVRRLVDDRRVCAEVEHPEPPYRHVVSHVRRTVQPIVVPEPLP